MAKESSLLTTGEFASQANIPVASVGKLIREGKIEAEKKGRKWMIHPSQLEAKILREFSKGGQRVTKKRTPEPTPKKVASRAQMAAMSNKDEIAKETPIAAKKTYSLAEFVAMTYLTENGVKLWLKQGRLSGQQNDDGQWRIDGANLDLPDVKRLVRDDKAS